jgi:uncharacterized protein (DUF2267 family)
MTDIKQLAAVTALNKMLAGRYFDICTIDRIASMLNIHQEGDAYKILRTLHCVHYGDMPAALKAALPDLIAQCFANGPAFQINIQTLERALPANEPGSSPEEVKKPGLLARLTGAMP